MRPVRILLAGRGGRRPSGRRLAQAAGVGLLLVVVCAGVVACGGGSSPGVAKADDSAAPADTGTTGTGTTATADPQDAQLKFAQCMRQHGVDIPDPTPDSGGNLRFGAPGSRVNRNDPSFQPALTACRQYLAAARPQITQADRTAFEDAAVKYAECMRQNGYDMPDPDFSQTPGQGGGGTSTTGTSTTGGGNGGGFRGPFGNIDRNDPKFVSANSKCESIIRGAFAGRGFGGGGGGPR